MVAVSTVAEAAFRVIEALGPHHRECVYARALAYELQAHALHVCLEYPIPVTYVASNGYVHPIGSERADILVDGTTVIECKVADAPPPAAIDQVKRYQSTLAIKRAVVVCFSRKGAVHVCDAASSSLPLPVVTLGL